MTSFLLLNTKGTGMLKLYIPNQGSKLCLEFAVGDFGSESTYRLDKFSYFLVSNTVKSKWKIDGSNLCYFFVEVLF